MNIGNTYSIQIEPGAFTDLKGNAFTGITDSQRLNFFVKADTEAPTLCCYSPQSYSTIPPASEIVLNFNESILIGSGNITLLNDQGDKRVISIRDTTQVTGTESVLTIKTASSLLPGSEYRVLMDQGIVTDLAGNAFEGLSDHSVIVFKVEQ